MYDRKIEPLSKAHKSEDNIRSFKIKFQIYRFKKKHEKGASYKLQT